MPCKLLFFGHPPCWSTEMLPDLTVRLAGILLIQMICYAPQQAHTDPERPLNNHHIHKSSRNSSLTPVCKILTHISPLTEPLLITETSRRIQSLSVNIPSSVVILCHVWNNVLSHLFFPINKCPEEWRPGLCCTFSWSWCKYFSCICMCKHP